MSSTPDLERVMNGELWRIFSSQIIFRNKAQAVVGLILLYTCRQFERQMGSRKFGAFLFFSLISSILSLINNLSTVHVPKLHSSQYALLGVEFSEKSWIYLLSCQLILCDGLPSIVAAATGLMAGYLYDRDGYGLQNFRLPQRVEVIVAIMR